MNGECENKKLQTFYFRKSKYFYWNTAEDRIFEIICFNVYKFQLKFGRKKLVSNFSLNFNFKLSSMNTFIENNREN